MVSFTQPKFKIASKIKMPEEIETEFFMMIIFMPDN
jgi:hypothetical protein